MLNFDADVKKTSARHQCENRVKDSSEQCGAKQPSQGVSFTAGNHTESFCISLCAMNAFMMLGAGREGEKRHIQGAAASRLSDVISSHSAR